MTRNAIVAIAAKHGAREISAGLVRQVLSTFQSGSANIVESMPWDDDAREGLIRAPDLVRGTLIKEVEEWAKRHDRERIDLATLNAVKQEWQSTGNFHLDPHDPRRRSN
jgi:hypothetical protein